MEGGPSGFKRGFTCPVLLGCRAEVCWLRAWGCHPLRRIFPNAHTCNALPCARSHNPGRQAPRFGLFRFRSPLLTESLLFSFPPGTEMFHFPGFASRNYFIHHGIPHCLRAEDCSIRKSAGQWSPAPDRGLSQLATSFIASCRQGIHHPPIQPGRLNLGPAGSSTYVMPPVWAVGDLSKGSPRHQSRDGNPKRLTMHGFCLCFRLNRRKMRRSLYLFASGCQRASPGIKNTPGKIHTGKSAAEGKSKKIKLVGARGLEPRTSSLSETRSNQLSYAPRTAAGLPGLWTAQ